MMTVRDYNKQRVVAQANDLRRSAESVRKLCKNCYSVDGALIELAQTQPGEQQ
jgi:hypothetical protein